MKTDNQIQQDVSEQLKWDVRVTASEVGVTVKDGIVTLSGTSPHYIEKLAAEESTQKVGGVRAVANEIKVSFFNLSFKKDDRQIAEAAVDALLWDYEVPDGIKVSVSDGRVTLKGSTEWAFQKEAAKNAVKSLIGVKDVNNEILIKSKAQAPDVKSRIEAALKRSAEKDGKNIKVKIHGDRVTLSGNVHSVAEKEDACWAAFCAPGIIGVDNELSVSAF